MDANRDELALSAGHQSIPSNFDYIDYFSKRGKEKIAG
jgi:hypothetical protein